MGTCIALTETIRLIHQQETDKTMAKNDNTITKVHNTLSLYKLIIDIYDIICHCFFFFKFKWYKEHKKLSKYENRKKHIHKVRHHW